MGVYVSLPDWEREIEGRDAHHPFNVFPFVFS